MKQKTKWKQKRNICKIKEFLCRFHVETQMKCMFFRISGQRQIIIMGDMSYVYTQRFFEQFFAKFVYGSFDLIHTYYP